MAKIVLYLSGENMLYHGRQLKSQLAEPDSLVIVNSRLEHAASHAKKLSPEEIDVIIARGTIAQLLSEAELSIPIVTISISSQELIAALQESLQISNKSHPKIGYLGITNSIQFAAPFFRFNNLSVMYYEIHNMNDIYSTINTAREDQVDVLIGGDFCYKICCKEGMPSVLLKSSFESIRNAYSQALEIQKAIIFQKKTSQEKETIINSVSDGVITLDHSCSITSINKQAEALLDQPTKSLLNKSIRVLFPQIGNDIFLSIESRKPNIGLVFNYGTHKLVLNVYPITANDNINGAVITLQQTTKIVSLENNIRKALYHKGNSAQYTFSDILGESVSITQCIKEAKKFSSLDSNVLIIGETGTGKELFAQSIHASSPRKEGPFVAVNCGSFSSTLLESELFGYADGAFTGSKKGGKIGLIELAHGGTLFLDEVSELDSSGQVSLLRVLQERQVRRIGGNSIIPVDVRIIAACNRNLYQMVKENTFRLDLYYRLCVLTLPVPSLNDRNGDAAYLCRYFISKYCEQFKKSIALSDDALNEISSFSWNGNVRQLQNFCERVVALSDTPVVSRITILNHLQNNYYFEYHYPTNQESKSLSNDSALTDDGFYIRNTWISKSKLENLAVRYSNNKTRMAEELGISRTTLWKLLKKF